MVRCRGLDWKQNKRKILRPLFPVGISLGMIYLSWIYSQHICWNEVYTHHSKATGIGLIIGNCLLIILLVFIWIQVVSLGPGIQPHIPVFRLIKDERTDYRSIDPPEYFYSDANGYPIWCSTCQTIKANRSHHSSDMNRCVPKFDHYCSWIGSSIGKRNYRLFVQFVFWYMNYFIYIGVSGAVYMKRIKQRNGSINGNLIAMFVADVFWLIMLVGLFASHLIYIYKNIASIDDILTKRKRKQKKINDKYISLQHEDKRYVLRINPNQDFIWDKGAYGNWKEVMGSNPVFWIIPWNTNVIDLGKEDGITYEELLGDYNEVMDAKWLEVLKQRIKNDEYIIEQ